MAEQGKRAAAKALLPLGIPFGPGRLLGTPAESKCRVACQKQEPVEGGQCHHESLPYVRELCRAEVPGRLPDNQEAQPEKASTHVTLLPAGSRDG